MADTYLNPATKKILKEAAEFDGRTLDGEVHFLCKQRLSEIKTLRETSNPSVDCKDEQDTKVNLGSQGEKPENSQKAEVAA